YEAILEALLARERSGAGALISISMFDAMADWMAVPLIQHEGGAPPKRMGLAHTSIAPYGVFKTADGVDVLISIQSDRQWRGAGGGGVGREGGAPEAALSAHRPRGEGRARAAPHGAGGCAAPAAAPPHRNTAAAD